MLSSPLTGDEQLFWTICNQIVNQAILQSAFSSLKKIMKEQ